MTFSITEYIITAFQRTFQKPMHELIAAHGFDRDDNELLVGKASNTGFTEANVDQRLSIESFQAFEAQVVILITSVNLISSMSIDELDHCDDLNIPMRSTRKRG